MMSRAIETIAKQWRAEAPRHFLWLPVAFAAGIALYMGLSEEPSPYLFQTLTVAAALLGWRLRARFGALMLGVVVLLAGAAWANMATLRQETTVLREALSPRPVTGIVRYIQRTEHGVRLTLDSVSIKNYPPQITPPRVRISLRLKADSVLPLPHIGDAVSVMAGLRPPMGPALPHGFDFARYFYFRGIGAVGYGLPPWTVMGESTPHTLAERFWDWRIRTTDDIIAALGKGTGSIAAGLITGDAKAISETDFEALRASNLYHIIAISGEHMVIIAGVIFVGLRLAALLLPRRLAFRPEVKTAAAIITLVLVTAYLFVTGLPISAVRAYWMIFLVLMAVILRRKVNAMRSLSLAALAMLVWDPASLLEPGFQLSFVATVAIIALVESRLLMLPAGQEIGRLRRAWHMLVTMLLISVVAEAATAPLVIAMFNNLSLYGVFANMVATPVVSLFLMPTVALYFILLPLGLQGAALWLMDWGIRALLGIAHAVAGLPFAQLFVPSIPSYGVALCVMGFLWLCLWQARGRRMGLVAILLGLTTLAFNQPPDMLVGGELKQIALRTDEGYALARGRKNAMIASLWANGLGYRELPKAPESNWRCDALGCAATVGQHAVAFPKDAAAVTQDCTQASLLFTPLADIRCDSGARVVNQSVLAGNNVVGVWFSGGDIRVETSTDWQGNRPWSAITADDEP